MIHGRLGCCLLLMVALTGRNLCLLGRQLPVQDKLTIRHTSGMYAKEVNMKMKGDCDRIIGLGLKSLFLSLQASVWHVGCVGEMNGWFLHMQK